MIKKKTILITIKLEVNVDDENSEEISNDTNYDFSYSTEKVLIKQPFKIN